LVPDARVTAEILEFGTLDPAEIGETFNANHHFHMFGDPLSPSGRAWGARYRHYCYPEETRWKEKVWANGERVIKTTLEGLTDWADRDRA
jgi:hypothetical protein